MNKQLRSKNISEGKALNIIQKPILTEKSTNLNQFNQYTFRVDLNTSIVRGKLKTFKGAFGYKKNYKKAIVTLTEGQTIDSSLEIK